MWWSRVRIWIAGITFWLCVLVGAVKPNLVIWLVVMPLGVIAEPNVSVEKFIERMPSLREFLERDGENVIVRRALRYVHRHFIIADDRTIMTEDPHTRNLHNGRTMKRYYAWFRYFARSDASRFARRFAAIASARG